MILAVWGAPRGDGPKLRIEVAAGSWRSNTMAFAIGTTALQ
jgi:hypothetical protein